MSFEWPLTGRVSSDSLAQLTQTCPPHTKNEDPLEYVSVIDFYGLVFSDRLIGSNGLPHNGAICVLVSQNTIILALEGLF